MAKTHVEPPSESAAAGGKSVRIANGHAAAAVAVTEDLQEVLRGRSRDELLQALSPQRKALYERIVGLRQLIGKSPIEVEESLRELRENA